MWMNKGKTISNSEIEQSNFCNSLSNGMVYCVKIPWQKCFFCSFTELHVGWTWNVHDSFLCIMKKFIEFSSLKPMHLHPGTGSRLSEDWCRWDNCWLSEKDDVDWSFVQGQSHQWRWFIKRRLLTLAKMWLELCCPKQVFFCNNKTEFSFNHEFRSKVIIEMTYV